MVDPRMIESSSVACQLGTVLFVENHPDIAQLESCGTGVINLEDGADVVKIIRHDGNGN